MGWCRVTTRPSRWYAAATTFLRKTAHAAREPQRATWATVRATWLTWWAMLRGPHRCAWRRRAAWSSSSASTRRSPATPPRRPRRPLLASWCARRIALQNPINRHPLLSVSSLQRRGGVKRAPLTGTLHWPTKHLALVLALALAGSRGLQAGAQSRARVRKLPCGRPSAPARNPL